MDAIEVLFINLTKVQLKFILGNDFQIWNKLQLMETKSENRKF
jgi:hypothetical protein